MAGCPLSSPRVCDGLSRGINPGGWARRHSLGEVLKVEASFAELSCLKADEFVFVHSARDKNKIRANSMACHCKSPHFPHKANLKDGKTFHEE